MPPVSEQKEESFSKNKLEQTLHDSLASEEVLVQQIKKDILDGVSSNRTEDLLKTSSQADSPKPQMQMMINLLSKIKMFYQKHQKTIVMFLFFIFFFKLILLVVWILI